MPKSKKKKQKEADFKKQTLKVGKSKPLPSNRTDVSFQSKKITLKDQSILEEKTEVTTSRNQTIKDLLTHAKHYSSTIRKDAVSGLLEILEKYPYAIHDSLGGILEGSFRLMIDDDDEVRKGLYEFYLELMPTLEKDQIRPFQSLVMAFTSSAMTHLMEDVRLTSLKFLRLWLQYIPESVLKFSDKVIGNFLSLLNLRKNIGHARTDFTQLKSSNSSGSSTNHLYKSQVEILNSLHMFLQASMDASVVDADNNNGKPGSTSTTSIDLGLFVDGGIFDRYAVEPKIHDFFQKDFSAASSALPSQQQPSQKTNVKSDRITVTTLETRVNDPTSPNTVSLNSSSNSKSQLFHFADSLIPLLTDIWLETAPTLLTTGNLSSSSALLSLMEMVLTVMNLLWKMVLQTELQSHVSKTWLSSHYKTLSRHFLIYFPFQIPAFAIKDSKVENLIQSMNIHFAQILANFYLVSSGMGSSGNNSDNVIDNPLSTAQKVVEYVTNLLDSKTDTKLVNTIKPETLNQVLGIVKILIKGMDSEISASLLNAVITYHTAHHSTSVTKRHTTYFLGETFTKQSSTLTTTSVITTSALEWFATLPKLAWELKGTDHALTNTIFETILKALRNPLYGGNKDLTKALLMGFIPYFYVKTKKGAMFGPFSYLPMEIQKTLLSVLYYLPELSEKLVSAVLIACLSPTIPTPTLTYFLDILEHHHTRSTLPHSLYINTLLTKLLGYTSDDLHAFNSSQEEDFDKSSPAAGLITKKRFRKPKQDTSHLPDSEIIEYYQRRIYNCQFAMNRLVRLISITPDLAYILASSLVKLLTKDETPRPLDTMLGPWILRSILPGLDGLDYSGVEEVLRMYELTVE